MPQLRPGEHQRLSVRHRSAASQVTNASGVADSTLSFYSTAATNESLHLSQFPSPPPSLPATPRRFEFLPSPPVSHGNPTPPASLDSASSTRHVVHRPPDATGLWMVQGYSSTRSALSDHESGMSSSSYQTVTGRDMYDDPPPPFSHTAPLSPISSTSYRPLPSPPGMPSRRMTRPPPLQPDRLTYHPSDISSSSLSPHDWHEGSSSIGLDPTEDRLLSTAFITSLLSSADEAASDDGSVRPPSRYEPPRRHYPSRSVVTDGMSAVSEMTYPPAFSRFGHSPSPEYYAHAPTGAPPQRGPRPEAGQRGRPPPTSFMPVGSPQQSSDAHRLSGVSGDSETLAPAKDNTGSVIRTASMTRAMGPRGISVVGVAPATLQKISVANTGQDAVQKPSPESEKDDGMVGSEGASSPDYYRDSGGSKVGLPPLAGPSSYEHGPALPSTAGTHNGFPNRQSRYSLYSSKSSKSYVSSLLSRLTNHTSGTRSARSVRRAMSWLRKPLPPVPTLPHIPVAEERAHREEEDSLPLPELVYRAGALSQMLEKGDHPHRSYPPSAFSSSPGPKDEGTVLNNIPEDVDNSGTAPHAANPLQFSRDRRPPRLGVKFQDPVAPPASPKIRPKMKSRQVFFIVVATIVVIALIIVGIAVGIIQSRKKGPTSHCTGNMTGAACNLDATCVCTSTSGQCVGLAQSIVSLTPTLNSLFGANFTVNNVSTAIWQAQGTPTGGNCASQALLIDVEPALNAETVPNRTAWAQSALLWSIVQSEDLKAVSTMQKFVLNADWPIVGSADGPVQSSYSVFSTNASGYVFDFAAQTVTQQIQNASFMVNGQPSSAQITQVGGTALSALNHMYNIALAASTQRQVALTKYWQSVLQQNPSKLSLFMSLVSAAPILIPFDATSSPLATMLNSSSPVPFPPPLACYPGLNSTQMSLLNTIETSVFALPAASSASQFDTSCYPNRPIYGVLDLLQLRLPFIDSQTGAAKQAAVLSRDVAPRAVVYSGAILSTLPNTSGPSQLTISQTDPRQYGTLSSFNHVILNYLTSIPDVNVAIALVEFVLDQKTVPPSNTSALFQSLSSIPTLEVAVFGSVDTSDIISAVTSFTTPSGSLFFGSDQGAALRNWALSIPSSSIAWSESATSSEVVRDTSLSDTTFLEVWAPAYTFVHESSSGSVSTTVNNIIASFQSFGRLGP